MSCTSMVRSDGKLQRPPDGVVQTQSIDILEGILQPLRRVDVVQTSGRPRQLRGELLAPSEAHWSTTESARMWKMWLDHMCLRHEEPCFSPPWRRWRPLAGACGRADGRAPCGAGVRGRAGGAVDRGTGLCASGVL